MKKVAILISIIFLINGCGTIYSNRGYRASYSSSNNYRAKPERAEIEIPNASRQEVTGKIIDYMIDREYVLVRADEYSIEFKKQTNDYLGAMLISGLLGGSRYKASEDRITYILSSIDSGIKAYTMIRSVYIRPDNTELDINNSELDSMITEFQSILDNVKYSLVK